MNAAAYEGADIIRQAATLFWGIAANHAFRDGNKRTAVVLLRSFLNLNGHEVTLGDDAIFDLAIGVAESRLNVDAVEAKLRHGVTAL
jgi:death-on-curing protein